MQIYKVFGGKIHPIEVYKETDCYYWFIDNNGVFGYASRIIKRDACLTPQQAIQEALNGRKTMKGAFEDKLAKVNDEILNLESLEQDYNKPFHSDPKKPSR